MEEMKKYEIITNTALKMITAFSIITTIVIFGILKVNESYELSRVWNISFLIPTFLIYFASIIQLIVCIWNTGKCKIANIMKSNSRKSALIFSSSITFMSFLFAFFMYILMTIILFS